MAVSRRREGQDDAKPEDRAAPVAAPAQDSVAFAGGNRAVAAALGSSAGQAGLARALAGAPGVSNRAMSGLVQRQDHSGPSYAHHGPAGGVIDERRNALTPQSRLGEVERGLSGELAQSVGWIGDAVSKIYALIEDARKADREGKSFFGDDTIEMTQKLTQIVEALNKLQIGIRSTAEKVKDANASLQRFEEMDKATQALTAVVGALATLKSGADTDAKLKAFQAKPDAQSAEAWADSVVGTFDNFGKLVGALNLPPGLGWIVDYFQGLLGAPKAYVGFFKATMKARYGQIDREIGRLENYHQFLKEGEKIVWAGPACDMVGAAWFFDQFLQGWIREQQENKGVGATDLYVYGSRDLATILNDKLQSDRSVTEDQKLKWGAWLASYAK